MLAQDQLEYLRSISKSQYDFNEKKLAYETYGHHFNYNIAVTNANTYVIKGKPSMNTDAIAGAVKRFIDPNGIKVCGYIRIIKLTEEECILGTRRRDELDFDIPEHTYTFTRKDAEARGLLSQRAWKTMIKTMLHKRCLAALLRAFYSDIIGVTYSPDELAEVLIEDEKERDEIVYASAEQSRVPTNSPATVKPPTANPATVKPPTAPPANPFPREFESVQMTASEALHNIDILQAKQIDNLANEIKSYLMGVVFDANPKEFVRTALSKLKIKEYQITVDAIRDFTKSAFNLDEKNLKNHFIDTDIDINTFNQNAHSYINLSVDNVKLDNNSFILYVADCKKAAVSHTLMSS